MYKSSTLASRSDLQRYFDSRPPKVEHITEPTLTHYFTEVLRFSTEIVGYNITYVA